MGNPAGGAHGRTQPGSRNSGDATIVGDWLYAGTQTALLLIDGYAAATPPL
jgi:hypothetical protein